MAKRLAKIGAIRIMRTCDQPGRLTYCASWAKITAKKNIMTSHKPAFVPTRYNLDRIATCCRLNMFYKQR